MFGTKKRMKRISGLAFELETLELKQEYMKKRIDALEFEVSYAPMIGSTVFALDGKSRLTFPVGRVVIGELLFVNGRSRYFNIKVDEERYPGTDGIVSATKIYPIDQLDKVCQSRVEEGDPK